MAQIDTTRSPHTTDENRLLKNQVTLPGALMQNITHIAPAIAAFTFTQTVVGFSGGHAPLAYLIGFILVLGLGMCLVQLAKNFPSAGGYFTFATRTLGANTGFLTGWMFVFYSPIVAGPPNRLHRLHHPDRAPDAVPLELVSLVDARHRHAADHRVYGLPRHRLLRQDDRRRRGERRSEFNWLWHFILPVGTSLILLYSLYKSYSPAPAYPYNYAPWIVAGWFLIGVGVLIYLRRKGGEDWFDRSRDIADEDLVMDTGARSVPESLGLETEGR